MLTPLLFGILLPAVIAGIIFGGVWRVWSRNAPPLAGGTWAGSLALAVPFIAGYCALQGWPGMPPVLAEGWLPFVGLLAAVVVLLENFVFRSHTIRGALWLVLFYALFWELLGPRRSVWSAAVFVGWSIGLSLAAFAVASIVERVAEKRHGSSLPLSLWVWMAGTAGALAMTGSLKLGQFAGMLAAAMGAGVVIAWLKPSILFSRGAVATLFAIAAGLLTCGYFYSDLPASSAAILLLAPIALWLGECACVTKRTAWQAVLIRVVLVAVPVGVALLIAAWPMLTEKQTGAYY